MTAFRGSPHVAFGTTALQRTITAAITLVVTANAAMAQHSQQATPQQAFAQPQQPLQQQQQFQQQPHRCHTCWKDILFFSQQFILPFF